MLNATVLALGVLPNRHDVHVVVQRLVALHRATGADVGVEGEDPMKKGGRLDDFEISVYVLSNLQIERAVALADRRRQRPLQADAVLQNRVDRLLGDAEAAVRPFYWCYIDLLPGDGHLGRLEDLLHGGGNLRADAVAGNQGHDGGLAADAAQGGGAGSCSSDEAI